jgi:hypothetical protein
MRKLIITALAAAAAATATGIPVGLTRGNVGVVPIPAATIDEPHGAPHHGRVGGRPGWRRLNFGA